ncbi:MAG: HEAT repeat domain-containing protein [Euryarchaeota archaeon]|nr:HEAT repeat domain-containing protein [Euryarchaeota archaeon]
MSFGGEFFRKKTTRISTTDIIKIWVIVAFVLSTTLLFIYAFTSGSSDVSENLVKLTPHLFYIPLILMALWYPNHTLQSAIIIISAFTIVMIVFVITGIRIDFISTAFTVAIYLWVVVVISAVSISADKKSKEYTKLLENQQSEIVIPDEFISGQIEELKSEDKEIRESAIKTLFTIGDRAVEPLIDSLYDELSQERSCAARTLGMIGDERAIEHLIVAMKDDNKNVRETSAQALAKIGEPAVKPLIERLTDNNPQIKAGSVVALRITGNRDAVIPISALLSDNDLHVRREAAKALGRIGNSEIVPALIKALDDDDAGVRLRATGALGRIEGERATDSLKNILTNDPDPRVRKRAAEALTTIGTQKATLALRAGLSDEDKNVQWVVKEGLQYIIKRKTSGNI